MQYLAQICKVTIAVLLTAMVAMLFSTLTSCRSCTAEEEVVRWVPAPRDTVPEIAEIDSLDVGAVEEVVVKEAIRLGKKKKQTASSQTVSSEKISSEPCLHNTNIRPWSEALDLDSIELTIIVSDLEMQITQNLN